jgi:AmmeMemoRadiSam system protein B
MKRSSAVAGYFYEKNPESLKSQIEECFKHKLGPGLPNFLSSEYKGKYPAFIVPHAGYIYSGPIAANAYKLLAENERPETVVIIGPNHTGYGALVSIMKEGEWETPLGSVKINSDIANKLMKEYKMLTADYMAHLYEHSIEVQLPFLQYIYNRFDFVPICIMLQTLEVARELGNALAKVLKGTNSVVIASTDLNHYENIEITYNKDEYVIDAVKKIDEVYLMKVIEDKNISMCGPCPTAAVLHYAKKMGCQKSTILAHATSGDTYGPKDSVVGYLSACLYTDN